MPIKKGTCMLVVILIEESEISSHERVVDRPHGSREYDLIHVPAPTLFLQSIDSILICTLGMNLPYLATCVAQQQTTWAARKLQAKFGRHHYSERFMQICTSAFHPLDYIDEAIKIVTPLNFLIF